MFRLRSTLGGAVGVSLVALNLAACSSSGSAKAGTSSSGSTQASNSTASTASTAAANAASAPAQNGSVAATSAARAASGAAAPSGAPVAVASGEGEPLAPIGCGGITTAMVNDLVTTPVTSVTFSSGFGIYPDHHFECDAGMRVAVYPKDSDKSEYTSDLASENAPPNPIPGVGDVAVYTLATLAGMPDIYAHKGTVTCEILPSSTVTDYKVAVDPNSVFGGITKEAGAAWATKAAGLCTAIFTALKA
jgi:hypothetical protein